MKTLDAYRLKQIAIIGMFFNHMVIALREVLPLGLQFPLYAVGGLTFPIMAFFVVEGYKHTSNIKKYLFRVFIVGVIAQIPYMIALRLPTGNIMFTIFLGLLVLLLYDKMKSRGLFWFVFMIILGVSMLFDWGLIGIMMIFLYRTISDEQKRRIIPGIIAGVFMFSTILSLIGLTVMINTMPEMEEFTKFFIDSAGGIEFLWVSLTFGLGCFAAAFLLKNFNGERGKSAKYLFYAFYPLHFVVLGAIAYALDLTSFSTIFNLFNIFGV
ncbi:MAG: conjugal transfer protein TraX [Defluviitaleaceae bacterium]|nr:conjugal transfer protein TraX [Defluviitaleaceae bacterium]